LEDTPDGLYYTVRVDEVIEPAVRPFEDVRNEVEEAWIAARRAEAVEALATETAERIRNGEAPQAVAGDIGAEFGETPALRRAGNSGDVAPALVDRLFGMTVGEVAVVPGGGAQIVARLTEIIDADPAEGDEALASLNEEIERGMAQDLVAQFTRALRTQYDIDIHQAALDAAFRSN
ncbi:MAG TPA: peptidyl-prolyl cis-trans isomerase, partial [Alphaproteobacteria bacterium]|nr:peptidyl-prolyl cis-trans isomerase [Alphaproteobacteria bacterium]